MQHMCTRVCMRLLCVCRSLVWMLICILNAIYSRSEVICSITCSRRSTELHGQQITRWYLEDKEWHTVSLLELQYVSGCATWGNFGWMGIWCPYGKSRSEKCFHVDQGQENIIKWVWFIHPYHLPYDLFCFFFVFFKSLSFEIPAHHFIHVASHMSHHHEGPADWEQLQ